MPCGFQFYLCVGGLLKCIIHLIASQLLFLLNITRRIMSTQHVRGSINGGTPQIIHSNGIFHYKPSIWGSGYPHLWKPNILIPPLVTTLIVEGTLNFRSRSDHHPWSRLSLRRRTSFGPVCWRRPWRSLWSPTTEAWLSAAAVAKCPRDE